MHQKLRSLYCNIYSKIKNKRCLWNMGYLAYLDQQSRLSSKTTIFIFLLELPDDDAVPHSTIVLHVSIDHSLQSILICCGGSLITQLRLCPWIFELPELNREHLTTQSWVSSFSNSVPPRTSIRYQRCDSQLDKAVATHPKGCEVSEMAFSQGMDSYDVVIYFLIILLPKDSYSRWGH